MGRQGREPRSFGKKIYSHSMVAGGLRVSVAGTGNTRASLGTGTGPLADGPG